MKNDESKTKRYGVIAQDLLEVNPALVYTNNDGMYSVAYTDLLVAKTARQDQKIQSLENTIESLIKRIEKLENEK